MFEFVMTRRSALLSASALAVAGCAKSAPTKDLSAVAEEAALWGYPLVQTGRYLKLAQDSGARLNQFYLNPNLATPSLKIGGPNVDTIYGYAWLDVSKEPIVLDVPDAGDRYYSVQLVDAYENVFTYVGSRETGSKAGSYAITAPSWKGELPTGVKQIESPTSLLFLLTRTLVRSVKDAPAAQALQQKYTLAPLSNYPGGKKAGAVIEDALRVLPALDLSDAGSTYFQELDALVSKYPPVGKEAEHFKRYAALGLGKDFEAKAPAPELLQTAFSSAYKKLHTAGLFGEVVDGWRTNYHITRFIEDPLARAAANQYGPGGHITEEALYFQAKADSNGAPLDGAHHYELTFPGGQLPPVDGFWSITLYTPELFLVENPIKRYAINDRTPGLVQNKDGGLTIKIQHDSPTNKANWLPAPEGAFQLILRTYVPQKPLLEKTYHIPPVVAV